MYLIQLFSNQKYEITQAYLQGLKLPTKDKNEIIKKIYTRVSYSNVDLLKYLRQELFGTSASLEEIIKNSKIEFQTRKQAFFLHSINEVTFSLSLFEQFEKGEKLEIITEMHEWKNLNDNFYKETLKVLKDKVLYIVKDQVSKLNSNFDYLALFKIVEVDPNDFFLNELIKNQQFSLALIFFEIQLM